MATTSPFDRVRMTSNPRITTTKENGGRERVFVDGTSTSFTLRYQPVEALRSEKFQRWELFRDEESTSIASDISREMVVRNNAQTILSSADSPILSPVDSSVELAVHVPAVHEPAAEPHVESAAESAADPPVEPHA